MASTMKAAVLVDREQFEIRDVPRPTPADGQVLVRVTSVGVCGSDLHRFQGPLPRYRVYPAILGHEFTGRVAEVGPGVAEDLVGMEAACAPDKPCGECEWCRKGEHNVCPNVRFAASHGEPGCLSEFYVVHQDQLFPLPADIPGEKVALFEPLANGLHVVRNLVRPRGGETYAVIGAGAYGLSVVAAARQEGASAVYVSDLEPARLEVAGKLGADATCHAEAEDFIEFVRAASGDRGVDVVVDAAGELASVLQAFPLAAIHGKAVIAGIPPADIVQVHITAARRRELTIICARRSLGQYENALQMLATGLFDADAVPVRTFPLAETQQAFECARDRADGVVRAIITP